MRTPMKETRRGRDQEAPRSRNRRRSRTAEASARSPKSLSRSMNKRIWHNWLMQENNLRPPSELERGHRGRIREDSQEFLRNKEDKMKTKTGTKSRRRPAKKSKTGKRGDENKAPDRKSFVGANRDNTLANWVAGMASTRDRTIHRGNTLANWVRNSS